MKLGHSKYGWLLLGLLITGFSVVSPASGASPKPVGKATPVAKAEPAPPQKKLGPAPDKATNAKVNAYIEIINAESEKFNDVRREWLTKIDRKQGPTCKESVSIPQPLGPEGGVFDTYRKKLKAKPVLPPDAAALNMVDAIEELRKIGVEPGPHTEEQGRSEPGSWCKKLKETYPRLLAPFDKFKQGEREVRAYVDNFTDERDQRAVQDTLKKYGNHYRYRFASLKLEGKTMVRSVGAELGKDAPDAEVIKQKFASFFTLADETKATMDREPSNQKDDPYPPALLHIVIESVPKLKQTSTTMLETLAKKPDKKREEWLQRDWHDVVDAYNGMITYVNAVQFDKNQK